MKLATELGMEPEVAHGRVALARLARAAGRPQEASDHLRMAIALYRRMGMPFWLERAEAEGR